MDDTKGKKNDQNIDTDVTERPLDPSRNASDIMGDPAGQTGWTVGSAKDTSAEPTEEQTSTENLPGGIVEHPTKHTDFGTPKEAVNDKVYNHHVWQGMSQESGRESDDTASETEQFTSVSDLMKDTNPLDNTSPYKDDTLRTTEAGEDSSDDAIVNTNAAPYVQPENTGEQEVSGSTPDPTSDDDTLQNVQAVGGQPGEDSEHPQELNTGVDESEEAIAHH